MAYGSKASRMKPTGVSKRAAKKTPSPRASARARERANENARFKRTSSPSKKKSAPVRTKSRSGPFGH